MHLIDYKKSIIQAVNHPLLEQRDISLDIKRDDLLHPIISGNKARKLKYLLQDAKQKNCETLISMGGNWSNHLHALAFAANELGFSSKAFVRAHKNQPLTPTLRDCQQWGMELIFTERQTYSDLRQLTEWSVFNERFPKSYWITEGGFSPLAIKGIADLKFEVEQHYDVIFAGVGSATTLIGLSQAFPRSIIYGVCAFKGGEYLISQLQQQFPRLTNWRLLTDYHCGGFAKTNQRLMMLKNKLEIDNDFLLDENYNAKVVLALFDLIEKDQLQSDQKILWLHTGGLQGERSRNN